MAARVGWTLKRLQEPLTCSAAACVLLVLVAPPLIAVFGEIALAPTEASRALLQPRLFTLLGRSVAIALWTTLICLLVGVPLGALLARVRLPFTGVVLFLHALPLTLTPFITALAAFHLFGRQGWWGSPATAEWLFDERGCICVLAVCFTPVITTLTWLGARGTDPSGDEAARTVAGPWMTLCRIALPQAAPSIALGAIVVFTLVLAELAVPMFLRVDVYSAAVFSRLGGFAFAPGEGAALTLPLVALSFLLWVVERTTSAHRVIALPRTRMTSIALFDTRGAQISAAMAGALAAAIGGCPLLVMCIVAVNGGGFPLLSGYIGEALTNSLLYACSVSTIVVVLATALVSAVREHARFVAAMDAAAWLGFLLPPALFALGAIGTWNRPATQWLYTGPGIVVLALAARYAVLAIRIHLAGERQLSPSLAEAARVCGASYWRRLLRIQMPVMGRYIAAAWLLVFTFCVRDVETTALLYPPGGEPLTVRLFTLEANGPPAIVAAIAATLAPLTVLPLATASLLLRWRP